MRASAEMFHLTIGSGCTNFASVLCQEGRLVVMTPRDEPTKCSDVTFDMRGEGYGDSACDAELGDLLWNPKGGEGHVLVMEARCGTNIDGRAVDCSCGGWGSQPCTSDTLICECREDGSCRDHHYTILARTPRV